jgi:hypothetical protein
VQEFGQLRAPPSALRKGSRMIPGILFPKYRDHRNTDSNKTLSDPGVQQKNTCSRCRKPLPDI